MRRKVISIFYSKLRKKWVISKKKVNNFFYGKLRKKFLGAHRNFCIGFPKQVVTSLHPYIPTFPYPLPPLPPVPFSYPSIQLYLLFPPSLPPLSPHTHTPAHTRMHA